MILCSLTDSYKPYDVYVASIFIQVTQNFLEDGGNKFSRNIHKLLTDCKISGFHGCEYEEWRLL
jgi:hypothetical protein